MIIIMAGKRNYLVLLSLTVLQFAKLSDSQVDCITCVHRTSVPNPKCLNFGIEAHVSPSQLSAQHKEVYDLAHKGTGKGDGKALIYQCATYCGLYNTTEEVFWRTDLQEEESNKDKCIYHKTDLFDGQWCFCNTHQCNIHKPNDIPSCPFAAGSPDTMNDETTASPGESVLRKTCISALLFLISGVTVARFSLINY